MTSSNVHKILLFGLNHSGKNSIVHKLRFNAPSSGFHSYTSDIIHPFSYKGETCDLEIACGDAARRQGWKDRCANCKAAIFVLDSSNRERLEEARDELMVMLRDETVTKIPLLIFANKQDAKGSMNRAEVIYQLHLGALSKCNWQVQPSSAISGEGLYEGFDWLVSQLKRIKSESSSFKFSASPGAVAVRKINGKP
ncbi:ADP-ribosylation factor 3 [Halotydeus destructor]|nr:ADP-ribosylation factor 3 [Halotydeus destructor]